MNWSELFERGERWTVDEKELVEALADRRAERADD